MKLVGIVGSNSNHSYNRMLLQYIQTRYADQFELELLEIKDVPMFNVSQDLSDQPTLLYLNQAIKEADGVVIATPEHLYTIPTALKSTLEWLSYRLRPFINKPVYVIGASYQDQGTSTAQLHLRQILQAPGLNAYVLPGNEFLLGLAQEKFDQKGELIDAKSIELLDQGLAKFLRFVQIIKAIEVDEGRLAAILEEVEDPSVGDE